jgi:hypothetical protein
MGRGYIFEGIIDDLLQLLVVTEKVIKNEKLYILRSYLSSFSLLRKILIILQHFCGNYGYEEIMEADFSICQC